MDNKTCFKTVHSHCSTHSEGPRGTRKEGKRGWGGGELRWPFKWQGGRVIKAGPVLLLQKGENLPPSEPIFIDIHAQFM